ncbi:hypothetical protein GCM10007973_17530 [Polymorphobacter multimanifer]|uniref:DUF3576 domain-containing protein n=1 Tax=Polymorphobacter multimanifer TaxID=1070431 RepID=A0A841L450_9SPHN|nr:DUF3576 domain-containing protein [Polymorphobacter multimanifer]MBB6227200.1 hypothetical protein [Polymorphobacter multimanifer]GGI81574.1 hypothetical protein GCM10007973_17530 [Polymorphobacter multimanifer]
MRRPSALLASTLVIVLAASLAGCGKSREEGLASREAPARVTTIGVNAYLWRASLDTLGFMPIMQVDSNGGVIVTDWYSTPAAPNERVKVTVAILDTELRADALKVSAVRQTLAGSGWVDAAVRAGTVQKLEEVILGRARDLRRAQMIG